MPIMQTSAFSFFNIYIYIQNLKVYCSECTGCQVIHCNIVPVTKPSKKKVAPSCMQDWHVKGNSKADSLANDAAAFHTVPNDKAQPMLDWLQNLTLIQNMIIAVIKIYPQRAHDVLIMPTFQLTHKQQLFDASGLASHNLHNHENLINCTSCNSSVSIHTKHVFDFVSSKCIPCNSYVSLAVGNLHTHPSHQIVVYGGVLFCTTCGSSAVNKVIELK